MRDIHQAFIKDDVMDYTTDLEQLFTDALYDRIQTLKEIRERKEDKIDFLSRAVERNRSKWLKLLKENETQYEALDGEIKRLQVIWKDRVIRRRV